jgi:DNA-binding MarR family transcriptional regulator
VWQLSQQVWGAAEPTLHELGLTGPLAELMWVLDPAMPRTMGELAHQLRCEPSNVTFLAERLEERGLARRVAREDDRRARVIELTATGRRMRERLVSASLQSTPFARLSAAKRSQLQRLLAELVPEPATATGRMEPPTAASKGD